MKKDKIVNFIKKTLDKTIYVIEFIISIIFGVITLQILSNKAYKGFFPLSKIMIAGILGIIIIGIIIYICKKYKGIVEKIFISFAIPVSIGFAIFVLPLNVPDEGTHVMRAYDMSLGHIFTQIDEEGNSFSTSIKALENYSYARFQSYQDVINEIDDETNYDEKTRVICAAQSNSPILYIGTAIAFKICDIFNINIVLAIYMARLFNVVIFLILGYLSIKKIPFGKLALAIYLCMPMMLQQAASCSADAVLNAVLVYYIAHLIYMMFKEEQITKKDNIILFVLTALVAMFKAIYILIAGILFVIIFNKKIEKKQKIKTIGIMLLIGSIFAIGWYAFSGRYTSVPEVFVEYNKSTNVNSSKQISFIMDEPVKFLKVFAREYLVYGAEYIMGAVGTPLGWLNVNINIGIIGLYILVLIFSVISEESKYEFSRGAKIWILAILFAISVLLNISMYLLFTPVGLERICGVQGRYYTPILILPLLFFIKKENAWKIKNVNAKLMIISLILNLATLLTVFSNYV